MHVAVLGGGLQGCCIALELVARGAKVTLVDRNQQLLSRAAIANEGKIHLGYMYAADPGLATARMMIRGALTFASFFARHLGRDVSSMVHSDPAVYLVHRDSQRSPDEVSRYLMAVHAYLRRAAEGRTGAYFGADIRAALRPWSDAEREAEFEGSLAVAAFTTPEVAINPVELAVQLRARIAATPSIEVRLHQRVVAVQEDDDRLCVISENADGVARDRYDHVVNALWDGRLAIDETMGLRPNRRWINRFKYGVSCRWPSVKQPRSVTIISGPFGEVVSYRDGLTYLTWYPACLRSISLEITPPYIATFAEEPLRSQILTETLAPLAEIVSSLRDADPGDLTDIIVKGGIIVAWGKTDIDDPASELHNRFQIGVTSVGRFHSVDPGKLTMAPYFAGACVDRIIPVA